MEDVKEAKAGEIFALFGVECASGTTFTKVNDKEIVSCSSMFVPDPVLSLSLTPKSKKTNERMLKALNRFRREDPTFHFSIDIESEELVISGMGELHLQIYCERLKREYKIDCEIGKPIVNYRESINQEIDFHYLHKKQTGGAGQYAKIMGKIEPLLDIQEEQ